MTAVFHELTGVLQVDDANALTIPRAKALLDSIARQRDYSLIQLLRSTAESAPAMEFLIVDVECDDIPPRNAVGILYRERLALCVPREPTQLVEVLALRKAFPTLLHQTYDSPGGPPRLCLYFESPAAVMRTWTPPAFLRRIQWWLEKSARGELHPADQAVEGLFFASKYELILPWNYADVHNDPTSRFAVLPLHERPDRGFTVLLAPLSRDAPPEQVPTAAHIELLLPPVVHGAVERDPGTLGQLADLLSARGVDLLPPLRAALQARVGTEGLPRSADEGRAIVVLRIPLSRAMNAEPDGLTVRAFFVAIGTLSLGIATGALLLHRDRYFQDVMPHELSTAWRDVPLLPMDVLKENDAAAARRQSGIATAGPVGVMIGAGSLGSALLNLWGRSGWGRWSVVDNDHIKPHNLSRHSAYAQHIGESKATVVARLHAAATRGASEIVPIVAEATDLTDGALARVLNAASLVVDASTTLEYPRAASAVDTLPRHISVFVTPNGDSAILLAEDVHRTLRLRTLESQYYRAVIQADWGERHLAGHARTFWSGSSCRDISVVMPYSRIIGYAGTLAEQVRLAADSDAATIRIWQRDAARGGVDVHDIPVLPEQRLALGELDLFIDCGVVQQLRAWRQQGLPAETGGVLLGYYDFNVRAVVVVAGLPAPPDSSANPAYFERGLAGLAEKVSDVSVRTAGMVGYIGEWHSHPRGHSAAPSGLDLVQLLHLALGMADDGLPAVQLIVGEHDLQILQGAVK